MKVKLDPIVQERAIVFLVDTLSARLRTRKLQHQIGIHWRLWTGDKRGTAMN